jgi:hypothetical protein
MWMDLFLLLAISVPLVSWSEIRLRPSRGPRADGRERTSTLEASDLQAMPAGQPHPSLIP